MKLTARESFRYCGAPDKTKAGLLIYGPDQAQIAQAKDKCVLAVAGKNGQAEMRTEKIEGERLRRDPESLGLAIKSRSFFAGPRAVCVDGASDILAKTIEEALAEWEAGDAMLIVTAGALRLTSRLRRLFESHRNTYAAPIYPNPPTAGEVEMNLREAGVSTVSAEARTDLLTLGRDLGPAEFQQLIHKISLYKRGDSSPLLSSEITGCAPEVIETTLDSLLEIVAAGHARQVGVAMKRLPSRASMPVSVSIAAKRLFRNIYQTACDPEGPRAGVLKLRPPVLGRRRDQMVRYANSWGRQGAEAVLIYLAKIDRDLRLGGGIPANALIERAMLHVALMRKSR